MNVPRLWLARIRSIAGAEISRTKRHAPVIAEVMGSQLIVQVLMAVTGVLIVRQLPKEDYAWFTLYTSLGAMMGLVADSGLSAGLNAHGGRLLPDVSALMRVHAAAKAFRLRLSIMCGLVVGSLGVYLLSKNHCPPALTASILVMTLAGMFMTTTLQMNVVLHNLLGNRRLVQGSLLGVQGIRLTLVGLCSVATLLNATTACVTAFLAQIAGTFFTGKKLPSYPRSSKPNESDTKELSEYVKQTMPNALFACVQAQIGALLLGAFGHTGDVANFGALSRVAVIFSVLSAPVFFLAAPAFAKSPTWKHLVRIAILVLVSYTALISAALVAIWLFPKPLLWLIGAKYSGLEKELFWVVGAQSLASVDTILWTVAMAKGWIKRSWLTIPLTLIAQAVVLMAVNPQTIWGVVCLNAAQTGVRIMTAAVLIFVGLLQWKKTVITI